MLCGGGSKKGKSEDRYILTGASPEDVTMGTVRDLHEFLMEAELDHYYPAFKNELKIASVPQLKYVAEEDLLGVGMTKPEMRRLKKYYKKECPQGKLEKFKRAFLDKANINNSGGSRTLSPSPPHNRISRPISYIRPTGKQIISSDSLEITKSLGEGEFGVVQQGVWQTEEGEKIQVAIKCLSRERLENGTQEFLKEAGLMQTIDHENIVRMYGVVLDKDNSLMLVTELAPLRSLLEVLKDKANRADFPLPRLCDFAQQICDGMSYLESKRLIHRDLAARNILVFSKSKVKISDFGLSRALGRGKDYYQSNFTINLKLPIAWCAPECINYLKFTSASDCWAFGVVMWELFTYGAQPWAGMNGQQILDAIDEPNNARLSQPDLCPKNYYDLMLQCWNAEPDQRPMFSEMFITLPQMRPTQVKAVKDFPEITVPNGYIYYRAYDVIVVLDKSPQDAPVKGLWKGVLMSGQTGFFDPMNTVPFIEPKSSPDTPTAKKGITRKDSKRSASKKLRTDMISRPQNDLRHTGHIGYDGAIFGDVGFIGDNYDKLPLKTASIGKLDDSSRNSVNLSRMSRMSDSPDRNVPLSLSDSSLNGGPKSNGYGKSWISIESLESQGTFHKDDHDDSNDTGYHDIDDDSLLADFKMPDLSSSFDFGSSFMDEVLRALNEKEAQIASSDKVSNGSPEEQITSTSSDRSRSMSPPKEVVKSPPPPLPSQPPRVVPRRHPSNKEPKPASRQAEPPRLQAKVKPMSTSDEKMMEDAISMANNLVSHHHFMRQESWNSQERQSDTESGSESPRLLSKIKASMKKSPKQDRKRTFSDNFNKELEDEVPPEAQEAYNMLVVHGSVKDGSKSYQRQSDSSDVQLKRESLISAGSSGHNFAYADSSSSSVSRTPDRTSPLKSVSRQSSERASASPPNLSRLQRESSPESRPVPRPRVEPPTPPRREAPVPRPRPEILRVEPTPRPLPPSDSAKGEQNEQNVFDNPLAINEDDLKKSEESLQSDRNSQEILRVDLPEEKIDRLNTSIDSGTKSTSPSDKSEGSSKFSFFEEEVSEPSPRDIMTKLARESRLRRSLDHQRGMSGDADTNVNKNLREPMGIPTKSVPASSGDDGEVDTNPLRMLRGGVIPVRGGRVGSGMSSNKPTLRHPKLHFSTSATLQHSVSVDAGRDGPAQSQTLVPESEFESNDCAPPALPPRSFSVCDSNKLVINPLPLPPRNIRRAISLNTKPRERIHPLKLDNITSNTAKTALSPPQSPVVCDDLFISRSVPMDNACHTENSMQVAGGSSVSGIGCTTDSSSAISGMKEKYRKPFPLPVHVSSTFSPLHEADSDSLANLPLAPPPPTYKLVETNEKWCDSDGDDNVFESPPKELSNPPQVSLSKQSNLTSEGGTSGSSTFPRGFKLFGIKNVKCNLEQLGFYNHTDPFWVQSVVINDQRSRSANSRTIEPDTSPLMLANYKCSEGVSYEDLLDFAIDRQKNGEEIELMQKLFGTDVTKEDCIEALEDTEWDLHRAIKYIKLKQLLSIKLGDASCCKEALLACDWNVQKAVDYMLGKEGELSSPPSPECVDV